MNIQRLLEEKTSRKSVVSQSVSHISQSISIPIVSSRDGSSPDNCSPDERSHVNSSPDVSNPDISSQKCFRVSKED